MTWFTIVLVGGGITQHPEILGPAWCELLGIEPVEYPADRGIKELIERGRK